MPRQVTQPAIFATYGLVLINVQLESVHGLPMNFNSNHALSSFPQSHHVPSNWIPNASMALPLEFSSPGSFYPQAIVVGAQPVDQSTAAFLGLPTVISLSGNSLLPVNPVDSGSLTLVTNPREPHHFPSAASWESIHPSPGANHQSSFGPKSIGFHPQQAHFYGRPPGKLQELSDNWRPHDETSMYQANNHQIQINNDHVQVNKYQSYQVDNYQNQTKNYPNQLASFQNQVNQITNTWQSAPYKSYSESRAHRGPPTHEFNPSPGNTSTSGTNSLHQTHKKLIESTASNKSFSPQSKYCRTVSTDSSPQMHRNPDERSHQLQWRNSNFISKIQRAREDNGQNKGIHMMHADQESSGEKESSGSSQKSSPDKPQKIAGEKLEERYNFKQPEASGLIRSKSFSEFNEKTSGEGEFEVPRYLGLANRKDNPRIFEEFHPKRFTGEPFPLIQKGKNEEKEGSK
ncbi:hypothetical protein PGTUg99_015382 [Puccinia graminis f. sp. tritici]|uniref:Uncharacterized protein n=1 Tax=Puccinia graminis f. sp. tritici TaxID=56615 RepID=A0A5B0RT38_PUCGR|nr:hypothetical protein PGTUg99_015382 [Puccinia graminis f. sp. tritici]